jgi:Uma2 family endonuclease
MKAVMPVLLPDILAFRKKTGADRFDEMWEGVLHMVPAPSPAHQDLAGQLQFYLQMHWARPRQGKVYHEVNLAPPGGWSDNYRIPDLLLLSRERFDIIREHHFEGAPDAVVEFYSPGDETYEKLGFYTKLGVPEVWIIHRDTREPEIHVLKKKKFHKQRAGRDGWVRSPGIGVEMAAQAGKLAIRLTGDESSRADLPED